MSLLSKMVFLFIYDNLQKPEIQKEVLGRELEMQEDSLNRYKKSSVNVEGEIFPRLEKTNNTYDVVFGKVVEISEEDLKKLDEYEGEDYKRIEVVLVSGKDSWVYVK